jgi:transposase
VSRYDLTDFKRRVIEPLPPNNRRGVPRVDDRRVLNGISWVLRSGAPWRDLPDRYAPRTTCYNRLNRWRQGPGGVDRNHTSTVVPHFSCALHFEQLHAGIYFGDRLAIARLSDANVPAGDRTAMSNQYKAAASQTAHRERRSARRQRAPSFRL